MISFNMLSSLLRAIFAVWALLLCLLNIASVLLAVCQKRYKFSLLAFLLFVPVYFLWQIIYDYYLFEKLEKISKISQKMCDFSWIIWFFAFFIFTTLSVLLFYSCIRYEKKYVTPNSIKSYLDKLSCGVCYYKDNGRVLFSNACMNELCNKISGSPLLNGNQFYESVKDKIKPVEEKMWSFTLNEIVFCGENLHELIASDITIEYSKTKVLEKDKIELSKLNDELKEYALSIDDTIRHQEILQAKVKIHDEMNRLMLSTMAAKGDDAEKLNEIFSLWEQNALLLCKEAEDIETKSYSQIEELAKALKIKLLWQNSLLIELSEKQKNLFFSTIQEAIINATKHANAKEISIDFTKKDENICCNFTNSILTKMQKTDITFTGGLSNISHIATEQGAKVSAEIIDDKFTLSLTFPIKNKPTG